MRIKNPLRNKPMDQVKAWDKHKSANSMEEAKEAENIGLVINIIKGIEDTQTEIAEIKVQTTRWQDIQGQFTKVDKYLSFTLQLKYSRLCSSD